jgi:heme/copper-type cytochrome/quinol oxidase subunit 3
MEIPYTVERRTDTGVNNVTLGIWLFLASELMLFGGLFSSYVILRAGTASWAGGRDLLHVSWAAGNTVVLLGATAMAAAARRAFAANHGERGRTLLLAAALGALAFVAVKSAEYASLFAHGIRPATSTFFSVYFLLTFAHVLHVAGGAAVVVFLAGPGHRLWSSHAERHVNRIGAVLLYMYFVDLIWVAIFASLYFL